MIRPCDVTVFVPTWNRPEMLRRMVRSLFETFPLLRDSEGCAVLPELIVWDDASSDREVRNVIRRFPHARLVESASKTSLAHAWNHAVLLSATPYVVLANDDLEFLSGDWWPAFCEKLEAGYSVVRADFGLVMHGLDAVLRAGWHDERFPRMSFEDDDWESRLEEAGLKSHCFKGKAPDVIAGRLVEDRDQRALAWALHDHAHPEFNGYLPEVEAWKAENRAAYFRKWSGLPTAKAGARPRRLLPEMDWYPGARKQVEARWAGRSKP